MKTIHRAHAILAALRPYAGTSATGNVTATATAGQTPTLPLAMLGFPVPDYSGLAALDPARALRVTVATEVDDAGGPVPVETVTGSLAHNLAAGTVVRWVDPPDGLEPTAVVAAGGLAGGLPGLLRRAVLYEGIATGAAARDLWLAKAGGPDAYPSAVLSWEGSQDYEPAGARQVLRADVWTIALVVARMDVASMRAIDGLDLLDKLEELFVDRQAEPLGVLSQPSVAVLSRDRILTTDTAYVYGLRIATAGGVRRRDARVFSDWERSRITAQTVETTGGTPIDVVDVMAAMPPFIGFEDGVLATIGDSLTAGQGVPTGSVWVVLAAARIAGGACRPVNGGVPGETTSQMLARMDTAVLAQRDPGGLIAVWWGGTNDCDYAVLTTAEDVAALAAAIYANATTFQAAAAADGAAITVIATLIPNALLTSIQDQAREAANALIRANGAGFTVVLDVAAAPGFETTGAAAYTGDGAQDGTHLSTVGNVAIADMLADAVNPLIGWAPEALTITSGADLGASSEHYADTVILSGADVASMVDVSGNGRHLLGASGGTPTTGNRPLLVPDDGDGLPAVAFDHTNYEALQYVGRLIDDADGPSTVVMDVSVSALGNGPLWGQADDAAYPRGRFISAQNQAAPFIVGGSFGTTSNHEVAYPFTVAADTWVRIVFMRDAHRERILVDGREVSNVIASGAYSGSRVALGAYWSTSGMLNYKTLKLRSHLTFNARLLRHELDALDAMLDARFAPP